MTYQTHPTFGVNEAVFGAASYAQAQYIQRTKKPSALSASIGDSATQPIIEGFEKVLYPKEGNTAVSFGAAAYVDAQTIQSWDTPAEEEEDDLEDDDLEGDDLDQQPDD